MIKFEVKNRYTGSVQFMADIDCKENARRPLKRRLAVLWAIENKIDLRGVNLLGANLSGANLSRANLSYTNLSRADLTGADLYGADLTGAKGIISFGPVGNAGRIGYAVKHDKCVKVKLGCFWGTEREAIRAIKKKYGKGSAYAAIVRAACKCLKEETND